MEQSFYTSYFNYFEIKNVCDETAMKPIKDKSFYQKAKENLIMAKRAFIRVKNDKQAINNKLTSCCCYGVNKDKLTTKYATYAIADTKSKIRAKNKLTNCIEREAHVNLETCLTNYHENRKTYIKAQDDFNKIKKILIKQNLLHHPYQNQHLIDQNDHKLLKKILNFQKMFVNLKK